MGLDVLRDRRESFNWSWADRGSSIIASVRYLFSDPTAWEWTDCSPDLAGRLPGAGVIAHAAPAQSRAAVA